jgi:hypothetical protein
MVDAVPVHPGFGLKTKQLASWGWHNAFSEFQTIAHWLDGLDHPHDYGAHSEKYNVLFTRPLARY